MQIYLFRLMDGTVNMTDTASANAVAGDHLGFSVAIAGHVVVAGAPGMDSRSYVRLKMRLGSVLTPHDWNHQRTPLSHTRPPPVYFSPFLVIPRYLCLDGRRVRL